MKILGILRDNVQVIKRTIMHAYIRLRFTADNLIFRVSVFLSHIVFVFFQKTIVRENAILNLTQKKKKKTTL